MQSRDEVAIVGYACRMPGAGDLDAFWRLLKENRCSVRSITEDRFSTAALFHPAPEQRGRAYTFAAGVLDDAWGFDAGAFGMSPREAEQVDPQQRHMLEVAMDAVAHAGIRASSLATSGTGVYIGASSADYAIRFVADPNAADVHMMTGNSMSIIANRISYSLDLRGPSLTIDTACSSSLVALHLAAEAIRSGSIDTAIVGGVNLLLSPISYVGFSRASMLSPTGLCRPFDAAADGYVRSEGAIAVVLRSMSAARKARSRIHGVIVASGVNQDGRTTGLSLPSADSQRRLLEQVYGDFGVAPADLLFVEAHGTGTKVGDPIEADALGKALGQRRAKPLPIGSVKSNVGHLEPVSGLAGLLKTLLALERNVVPATLHQNEPSPHIPFDELNLKVVSRNWRLPDYSGAGLAGVNSFGFGGTNSHVVLRRDTAATTIVQFSKNTMPAPLLLTAHSQDALPAVARSFERRWPHDAAAAHELIRANAHLRDPLAHRMLIRGETIGEIRRQLGEIAAGKPPEHLLKGQALGNDLPVVFLFSGNGSQWAGMGRGAWNGSLPFREALEEIDGHFARLLGWSIVEQLFADDLPEKLQRATYSQPLLFAIQVATVRALEAGGVTAAATLGHSVGEIAAAWAAGALSLPQAIDIVIARSRHQESAYHLGTMAAMMLSDREARRLLKSVDVPGTTVAAVNSWRSVTISGPVPEVEKVLKRADELKISARRIDVAYPFHSALVDSVRGPLLRELDGLKPLPLRRTMISSVTGKPVGDGELGAGHWWRNVRDPVLFETALGALIEKGFSVFLEIGPKPILGSYVRDNLRDSGKRGVVVETLGESDANAGRDAIVRSISKVLLAGGAIDLARFFGPAPAMAVPLPPYPWQHTPFVAKLSSEGGTLLAPLEHPLLGRRMRLDSHEWFATIDPTLFPWLADHCISGVKVFPATGYVEVMLAAGRQAYGDAVLELRDLDIAHPLVFDAKSSFETQLRLDEHTGVVEFLSRRRNSVPDWTINARGLIGRSPAAEGPPMTQTAADAVTVLKPRVYECAAELGYEYGPIFQRIHHVSYPHPKIAVGVFDTLPGALPKWLHTDLTALDAGFHGLLSSEEAGVADMPMKLMLPIRFASIRYFKPGVTASYVVTWTRRQSPRTLVLDIDLYGPGGDCIATARGARLVEAPAEPVASPQSLTYYLSSWQHDHPGRPAAVSVEIQAPPAHAAEVSELNEGLLLLEAGSLRAAWQAVGTMGPRPQATRGEEDNPAWQEFYRNALVWHLESHGLAKDWHTANGTILECKLPESAAIVRSLTVRHPTMIAETSLVAFVDERLPRILNDDDAAATEVGQLRRHHGLLSQQALMLRQCVLANVERAIQSRPSTQLLRLLMIGAEHLDAARDLASSFPNVEIVVADLDAARVEQAQLGLGPDYPRIRSLSWKAVEQLPPASFDLAFAVDALSELSAVKRGLASVIRVLRRGAGILAGEMAPSIFWDVVRGVDVNWWARSTNAAFPVGAFLTREEWEDEFKTAGLRSVVATNVSEDGHVGILVKGIVDEAANATAPTELLSFSWLGKAASEDSFGGLLRRTLEERGVSFDPSGEAADDCIWSIGVQAGGDPVHLLTLGLAEIAEHCRKLSDRNRRLWVVVDFGAGAVEALTDPQWCAITAAMRVAQNEYTGLQIKVLGLSGADSVPAAAAELMVPNAEPEVFFQDGKRFVFRLRHGIPDTKTASTASEDTATKLANRRSVDRNNLDWITEPRCAPEAGQIEIAVAAGGLNFRDVMWNMRLLPEEALEDGFAGPGLGMECAGVVARVGPGVQGLKLGDRVVAFAPNAFRSFAVVPAFVAHRIADGMTFEAASTIPVAFLTAHYSLLHLAHLKKGETVLIHGAAGGVGLAAIQIARHVGARIIATAGTEEKRAFLRRYGADAVCDSRTLSFVEEVQSFTAGRGVDVVLNSVAGEAMVRTMECLRPFGRFVELGKRDFFANTHVPLRPMRRNLSYFGVDVDQLIGEHAELAQQMFGDILALFDQGDLVPLPHRVFGGHQVQDAFRLVQRSGHVGKVVITPVREVEDATALSGMPIDPTGLHVVVGGTRGFGLATAEWLVDRGATRLVLASRSGVSTDADLAKIELLRERGCRIDVEHLDVADKPAVEEALRRWNATTRIKGIVHAAMVLDDRLIERIDSEAIEAVLRPKIAGALNLAAAAVGLELDYVLLFSSATTLFGNPGQYNYVAANGFIDGLSRRLRAQGIPSLAIAWGGIEDAGYLARNLASDQTLKRRFAASLISTSTALGALDATAGTPIARSGSYAIVRIDWTMAARELSTLRTPIFASVVAEGGARQSGEASADLERLKALPLDEVVQVLTDLVVEEIARVLRLPLKEVDRHRPLAEIGMDSLMMLELRNTVESSLQIELPMMSLSSGITPVDVATRIAPLVVGEAQQNVPGKIVTLSTHHMAADAQASDSTVQQVAVQAVMAKVREMDGSS